MEAVTARDYLRDLSRSTEDFTVKFVIDGIFGPMNLAGSLEL